jgi:hypothetical protein
MTKEEEILSLEMQINEATEARKEADKRRSKLVDKLFALQGREVELDTRNRMQEIGRAIVSLLPHRWGFFCLVFPFEDTEKRANYISNGQREDVIRSMKEFLIRAGHKEDWMEHLDE